MKKKYVIGVDVGGTNVKIAIIGPDGKIRRKSTFQTRLYREKESLIQALLAGIKKLLESGSIANNEILGIGIGTPGLIDSKNGIIHYLVNIRGFKEVPLKKIIEKELGIRTFLDNDVNMMCLGEMHYGSGKSARNLVCVTLGTGVGGGIVIEGKLYRGATLSAGEVGHITINEDGPKCNCGNRGCMETYVGNNYIVRAAIKRIKKNKKTLMYSVVKGRLKDITPKIISEAAKKGDKLAKSILHDIGTHLGVALAGIINVINPEKIIIGGGVADAGELLFGAIRKSIRKRAMKVPADRVNIIKARLGQDAGLIGALPLVKEGLNVKV